jgi:hypothetical protein
MKSAASSAATLRRQKIVAAWRARSRPTAGVGSLIENECTDPDHNSLMRMSAIDALSQLQRDLVNDYGYQIVKHLMEQHTNSNEMTGLCQRWREMRQQQLLSGIDPDKPQLVGMGMRRGKRR